MSKKQVILFSLILILFQGCKYAEKGRITVGILKGPTAISMAYMIDENAQYQIEGIDYKIFDEPLLLRNAILRNDVDIATIPSVMACNLINNGKNIQIAAIPIWGTLHLFGSESSIFEWNDLKGKEVYMMAEGLTPDLIFKALLKANKLIPGKDVKLNYSFPSHTDLANASIAGLAPLAVLSEPLVSRALDQTKNLKRIFDLNDEWNKHIGDSVPLAQTALVVNFDNKKLNQLKFNEFMSQYEACCNAINSNPEFASTFMVRHKILNNSSLAASAVKGCNIKFENAHTIENEILSYFDFIYNLDPRLTGGMPGNETMIYKTEMKSR